ncbi:hypothetical protein PFLUV_G00114470 [Perca fluviatilis]|uniref:Uncharacterized protein n=1 Tax=Perca fluviatilis TaxID=8168 RepID=A0A6A5F9N1_PERFL|nr:hypothetical protein PFLUV_G00114470 [Perca fluviatilis]
MYNTLIILAKQFIHKCRFLKVSVLTIHGPFSVDIRRPANPQTNVPAKSILVHRPQPFDSDVTTQAASGAVSSGPVSTPTTELRTGSCLNKDSVSRRIGSSTHLLIGYSPGFRPLRLAVVSALQECLVITSLRHQIQKKTPACPAA